MTRGKHICGVLKDIRRKIAEANDIELKTSECQFAGECRGTCPKCEAEIRYLENELRARRSMGKAVAIAGISAGLFALPACSGNNQSTSSEPTESTPEPAIELIDTVAAADTICVMEETVDTCSEPQQIHRITELLIVGEVEEENMTTVDSLPEIEDEESIIHG